MKKLIVILLAFAGLIAEAKVYYVASKGGSDSYAGTDINYPWATWKKAFTTTSLLPGDTVFIRGGIYYQLSADAYGYQMQNMSGTAAKPICIMAYPKDFAAGNYPILDCSKAIGGSYQAGILLRNCSFIHLKGLTVRNVKPEVGGQSARGFYIEGGSHVKIEQCTAHQMNTGFVSLRCDSLFFLNCDAFDNCDSLDPVLPGDGGGGFNDIDWVNYDHYVLYRGCRAWRCSDDGFVSSSVGLIHWDSCWSFNNGAMMGGGNGFKMGWVEEEGINAPGLNRIATYCLAAYNRAQGFWTNEDPSSNYTGSFNVFHNTSYHNGRHVTRYPGASACGFIIENGTDPNDEHELARIFKNNLSYFNEDADWRAESGALCTSEANSWDYPSKLPLTDADFVSLDSSLLDAPRKPWGGLPDLNGFMHLSKSCAMINAGVKVGLPFKGSAPDLGYVESNYEINVLVTSITVYGNGNATTINTENGTLQMNKTVLPSDATNKTVTWSIISGAGFATISSTGLLTAVKNGTVRVKATANDGSGVSGAMDVVISNQHIPVTSITVSGEGGSASISTDGGTLQLSALVLPVDATNKNVTWSVVNESGKASISPSGLVTAMADGIVTARATANDGSGIYDVYSITVSNQIIPVSALTVSGEGNASIITSTGGTLQLTSTVLPGNASDQSVTWSIINNTGQAIINSSGMVTAMAAGTVIARATANDGSGVFGTLTITISEELIPVSDIVITGENTMELGELTAQLSASTSPANATDRTITWSVSSGTGEATISSTGLVTALSNGSITVIATANDGSGVSESFEIDIASFPVSTVETKKIFIDPGNQGDLLQDGTQDHPFASWSMVSWKEGYSYLQKKGTLSYESKINITAGNVTLGSYGEGDQPVIHSSVNDFAVRAYEKTNIFINDLHIIAENAISCLYILGETCDNICIEYCTLESSVNGARILDGKNMVLRYNTFVNCSEGIYCYADNSTIYYNVFRDNEVAISAMASMAHAQIYNNVFYNNTIGISNTYTDLTLYNNIFYLVNSSDKAIYNNQLNQLISDNNIFYPEQAGFIQIGSKLYSSLKEYQHDLGLDLNSITDDPAFVDAYNQNYSVASGSPAINAGKLLGLDHDYYGTRVPSGGLPDIGLAELRSITASIGHLNDPVSDDFQVYPNPCQGVFNVYVKTNNASNSRIIIRDLSGKIVYEDICSSNFDFQQEIDISNMQKGIYIVAVEDNNRSQSQPIIIR